jgi:hypothetical protein
VSSQAEIRVGSVEVFSFRNGIPDDFLSIFRDDMMQIVKVPGDDYYGDISEDLQEGFEPAEFVDLVKFIAPGPVMAERLDLMGFTSSFVRDLLDRELSASEQMRINMAEYMPADYEPSTEPVTAQQWIDEFATSEDDPDPDPALWRQGRRERLTGLLQDLDECAILRAVLLAFPDEEVTFDLTDLELGGWLRNHRHDAIASEASEIINGLSGMHAPVVVLTEGRTDAEFIKAALEILSPHLNDLIRFLDYDQKTEGGASALVRMVRAFAAAGIVNRVVAIFDNDTAAADALRVLDRNKLPGHIQICTYPPIALAGRYPTLGPPRNGMSSGTTDYADVNGLAGSVELYLGEDVLTNTDGQLRPVQWKSYLSALSRYHGEVTEKSLIHDEFRKKCALATASPEVISDQDWDGMRLILHTIAVAAQAAFIEGPPTLRMITDF